MRIRILLQRALRSRLAHALFLLAPILLPVAPVAAQPVPGHLESFPGTSTGTWASGDVALTNPGTGGVLGIDDGYLLITDESQLPVNLGAFSKSAADSGDWLAAGITQVQLWLDDTNLQDTLEIHFALGDGAGGNFWQCNTGFIPPLHQWGSFIVDLTTPENFSQIGSIGGTFDAALRTVDRILVRHDKAPFVKAPNTAVGDFGLDEVLFMGAASGAEPPRATRLAGPVRLAPPAPNPSRGAVSFRMETSEAAPVRIQIVDVMGRVIRHGDLPAAPPGTRTWTWDGTDDRGVIAAAGYYRARAIGPSGGMSQPLLRVR
jgi:hypothetical protein